MTITGVQNAILEMLRDQDLISVGEIKLFIGNKQQIKDGDILDSLITFALTELEKNGIAKVIDNKYCVLVRPLSSYPQSIEIDGNLSISIAKVLNAAAALVTGKKDQELCNSMNISDKDIETLVFIADEVINNKRESKFDEFHLPPNQ